MELLLRFPEQRQRLIDEPALIKPAVEEFLRYESSNQLGNRRVTQDTEIDGVAIPEAPDHALHRCGESGILTYL